MNLRAHILVVVSTLLCVWAGWIPAASAQRVGVESDLYDVTGDWSSIIPGYYVKPGDGQAVSGVSPRHLGYKGNVRLTGFVADWCSTSDLSLRNANNIRLSDAFLGVRGMEIIDCGDILVDNSWFNGKYDAYAGTVNLAGVEVIRSERVAINNCTIHSFQKGVRLTDSESCSATGNKILLNAPSQNADYVYGFLLRDGVSGTMTCTHNILANNTIELGMDPSQAGIGVLESVGLVAGTNQYDTAKATENRFVYNLAREVGTASYIDKFRVHPNSIITP